MNIHKLEGILQDMRAAKFADLATAASTVRLWAEQIDEAISDHLIEGLGISFSELPTEVEGSALELDSEPSDVDAD